MRRRKTTVTKQGEISRRWHLVDLQDQVLGRVASRMAELLVGKQKPSWSPQLDGGDWVVAINADKVRLTGGKEEKKTYRWHTGYPGGFRERSFKQMVAKDPRRVIELAVWGMLPKNKLRQPRLRRLKAFVGDQHPYGDKLKTQNSIRQLADKTTT